MVKQRYFYRKDIETRKKPKSKEKIELKYAIQQIQVQAKFHTENVDI